ncbi:MAG: hypothetical protein K940chlam9_01489 [Chlamydiae bacterium]|nr:hypothetical protein [Chlamydiota bacterium]
MEPSTNLLTEAGGGCEVLDAADLDISHGYENLQTEESVVISGTVTVQP